VNAFVSKVMVFDKQVPGSAKRLAFRGFRA
jgi:hypothetical protein